MTFQTLADLDAKNKTVLLRLDLNVPMEDGKVADATRLERSVPTIRALQKQGARIVVLAHLDRPKGKMPEFSLQPAAEKLGEILGEDVGFVPDCIGDVARHAVGALKPGQVIVLENVRFYPEEEKNDPEFSRQLASLGDVYVNEAFSNSHRAHASMEGITKYLPSYGGLLMEEELKALTTALEGSDPPLAAIIGGSKISTKLDVLNNVVKQVNYLILGGGMQNTFFLAQGIEIGKSLCERDMVDNAKKVMATAKESGCQIILSSDRVIVSKFGENAPFDIVPFDAMPADKEAVDIGPATIANLRSILEKCHAVLWNGPMGVFEVKPFDKGTNDLARIVADLTQDHGLMSVAGGGDTVYALENSGVADQFSYLSTAGGAFVEWLKGKPLPGVQALYDAAKKAA